MPARNELDELVRSRRPRSHGTYELIVRTAADVFARLGYDSTSLELIAAEAGLAKTTIYYHFDSKETLYAAVQVPAIDAATDTVRRVLDEEPDILAALRRIVELAATSAIGTTTNKHVNLSDIADVGPAVRRLIRDAQRRYEHAVADAIRRGQEAGRVRAGDANVLALLVIGCTSRISRWYRPDGRLSPEEVTTLAVGLLLEGLVQCSPTDSSFAPPA
jgi:AcrR family transcriptional regulator